MHGPRIKRPSPAFVVAMIALFVALGGTAGAVVTAAVPLAKKALVAENAKKLGGQTSTQIIASASAKGAQAALQQSPAGPRPASSVTGLVTIKTQSLQIATESANGADATCDSGAKVVGGGLSSDGAVLIIDNYPKSDTTWSAGGLNIGSSTANATVYAVCAK
jgi:hypothetical protein